MPGGDKSGPRGSGPMTGRGLGYCTGNRGPGFSNWARGMGYRLGMRFRGGGGRRFNRFQSPANPRGSSRLKPEEEISPLEEEAEALRDELNNIEKRMTNLKKEKKQEP